MLKVISWTWLVPQVKCHPIMKSKIECEDSGSGSRVKENNLIKGSEISEKSLLTVLAQSLNCPSFKSKLFANVRTPNNLFLFVT